MNLKEGTLTVQPDAALPRIASAMAQVFRIPPGYTVTRDTSAADIEGWDSLSHSILIMKIEEEFGVDLPMDRIYDLNNVGELADLVSQTLSSPR